MTERSMFWTNGVGDGGPYTQDQWRLPPQVLVGNDAVVGGHRSELALTFSGGNVRIAPGSAIVDGSIYDSDANVDIAITTPTTGTTGFRVVLRKSYSARTVRLAVLKAADGTGTAPAVTQSAGVTWELSLGTGTITTGGTKAITSFARTTILPAATNRIAAADHSLTSQATLQNWVEGGAQPVRAGETWRVTMRLYVTLASSGINGIKIGFDFPAAAVKLGSASGISGSGATIFNKVTIPTVLTAATAFHDDALARTTDAAYDVEGYFTFQADGNIQPQWAQSTSHASAAVLKAGSGWRAERMA